MPPTLRMLLLLLATLLVQILLSRFPRAAGCAAFLGGIDPKIPKKIPKNPTPDTNLDSKPDPSSSNLATTATKRRYAFRPKPAFRDSKFFTATGNLPPLPSSCALPNNLGNDDDQTPVSVTYTNDPRTVDEWLCHNLPYEGCLLGFDIERLPVGRSTHPHRTDRSRFAHAAVIQLATPTACLVVHLVEGCLSGNFDRSDHHETKGNASGGSAPPISRHGHSCARILKSVLEDPSIVKAGCGIDEDLVLLHELWSGRVGDPPHTHTHTHTHSRKPPSALPSPSRQQQQRRGKRSRRGGRHHHHHQSRTGSDFRSTNIGSPSPSPSLSSSSSSLPSSLPSSSFSLQATSRFDLGCVVLPKSAGAAAAAVAASSHVKGSRVVAAASVTTQSNTNDNTNGNVSPDGQHPSCRRTPRPLIRNKSGLQGLSKAILGIDLPKDPHDSQSDWTSFPLTDDQITYAARDAWAGAAIARKLERDCHRVFGRSHLVEILRGTETPLPELALRHRQRREARWELKALLRPYQEELSKIKEHQRDHEAMDDDDEEEEGDDVDDADSSDRGDRGSWPSSQKRRQPWAVKSPIHKQHVDVAELFASRARSTSWTGTTKTVLKAAARNATLPVAAASKAFKKAHRGQQMQQALENHLPKTVRKKTLALRQMVNARVIDHKVVFEIDLVDPPEIDRGSRRDVVCGAFNATSHGTLPPREKGR